VNAGREIQDPNLSACVRTLSLAGYTKRAGAEQWVLRHDARLRAEIGKREAE